MQQSLRAALLVSTAVLSAASVDAQTLTSGPSTNTVVTPAHDYATTQWQDPWDMQQRTDLGWFTWGVDQPPNNMTTEQMTTYTGSPSNSGTSCGASGSSDCYTFSFTGGAQTRFFLLDTDVPGTTLSGKIGALRPIDTTVYKYLLIKVRFAKANNETQWTTFPQAKVAWSRNTIYSSQPNGGIQEMAVPFQTLYSGTQTYFWMFEDEGTRAENTTEGADANQWYIYAIRLDQVNWYNSSTSDLSSAAPLWGQSGVTADSLFIEPFTNSTTSNPGGFEVDWVQLTDVPASQQTITWTGGAADVLISQQAGCGNYTVLAKNKTSPFTFPFGSLPAGSYYVGLRAARNDGNGTSIPAASSCSSGAYVVPDPATLTFTTPTDMGSTDDFATAFLNNPWDFATTSDFERTNDITGASIETVPAQRPDGTSLGNVRVYDATSTQAPQGQNGQPYGYLFDFNGRGLYNRIDPSRYRILTVDMGVNHARDLANGSIARIVWHVSGDQSGPYQYLENVSDDIPGRSLVTTPQGVVVLDRIQFDMKDRGTLDLETDPGGSPSLSGWTSACISPWCPNPSTNPGVDGFRFDPHEFSAPTEFYIAQVRLAALEQTGSLYTLNWTATLPTVSGLNAKVYLYADPVVATQDTRNPPNTGVDLSAQSPTCDETALSSYRINSGGTSIPAASSYTWNVSTSSLPDNTEYYICGVVHGTINGTDMVIATTRTQFPIEVNTAYQPKPRLYMNRSVLYFDVMYDATTNSFTPGASQTVAVAQSGAGSAAWALSVRDSNGNAITYVSLDKTNGTGTGNFTVSVTPIPGGGGSWNLPACTPSTGLPVVLTLSSMGTTDNEPQYLEIFVTVRPKTGQSCIGGYGTPASAPPFGYMDTPTNNSTEQGAFGVTGWALDNIGIAKVMILRNCTTVDQQQSPSPCGSKVPGDPTQYVYVGDADRVADARPDVESIYPTYPESYKAAWGYLLLSNFLPHLTSPTSTFGGQGMFQIYAYAVDVQGDYVRLGATTVNLDNDHAMAPFGSIDTPDQGGQVPDPSTPGYTNPNAYPNFGWAMTQNPKCIVTTSTASYGVYIDSVQVPLTGGNWTASGDRPDLDAAFPGLCNTHNAVAVYSINVSALQLVDGVHTVFWTATDSGSNVGAFGSRFFSVVGGGVSQVAQPANDVPAVTSPVGRDVGRPTAAFAFTPAATGRIRAQALGPRGLTPVNAGPPSAPAVHVGATGLVQIDLPATAGASPWAAYLVRKDALALLPVGATFEPITSRFSWAPVPGFFGTYRFLFIRLGADGRQEKLELRVIVGASDTPRGR